MVVILLESVDLYSVYTWCVCVCTRAIHLKCIVKSQHFSEAQTCFFVFGLIVSIYRV